MGWPRSERLIDPKQHAIADHRQTIPLALHDLESAVRIPGAGRPGEEVTGSRRHLAAHVLAGAHLVVQQSAVAGVEDGRIRPPAGNKQPLADDHEAALRGGAVGEGAAVGLFVSQRAAVVVDPENPPGEGVERVDEHSHRGPDAGGEVDFAVGQHGAAPRRPGGDQSPIAQQAAVVGTAAQVPEGACRWRRRGDRGGRRRRRSRPAPARPAAGGAPARRRRTATAPCPCACPGPGGCRWLTRGRKGFGRPPPVRRSNRRPTAAPRARRAAAAATSASIASEAAPAGPRATSRCGPRRIATWASRRPVRRRQARPTASTRRLPVAARQDDLIAWMTTSRFVCLCPFLRLTIAVAAPVAISSAGRCGRNRSAETRAAGPASRASGDNRRGPRRQTAGRR